jgi:hypothetical protein
MDGPHQFCFLSLYLPAARALLRYPLPPWSWPRPLSFSQAPPPSPAPQAGERRAKRLPSPSSRLGGRPASASASPPSCFRRSVMSPALPTTRSRSRPTTGGGSRSSPCQCPKFKTVCNSIFPSPTVYISD